MQKNKLVIFGGGSAGWLTALSIADLFPAKNITLIQSSEVGIIGVGEASTPHLPNFISNLNIDVLDLVKNTNGSFKNGISFENWNGDGKRYFHSFNEFLTDFHIPNIFSRECSDFYIKNLIKNKLPLEDYLYQHKIAYNNRIDLKNTAWSLHFDAKLLAEYLENIGRQRGITVVDGKFRNVITDDQDFITNIVLEDGRSILCDFVFDCSGFHRVLIGKYYQQKWISYSDHLPMKRAISFWLESEDDIQPYTTATAMDYGWMWKIPLQHRIGSGYIFDSDYINEDQALVEAEKFYGRSLKINKIIDFDAGRIENFWVKNCMAIGLSSSFIEPLESTSLFVTLTQLDLVKHFLNDFDNPRENSQKLFNETMKNSLEEVLYFVYLHYLTKRQDTKFWREFREKNPPPLGFQDRLELIKENNYRFLNIRANKVMAWFELSSYLQVANGIGIFEKEMCMSGYENINPSPEQYKAIIDKRLKNSARSNKEFLRELKGPDSRVA
jgi:tryptophan halogenase